jgi:putative restriction endonuclease
MSVEYDSGFFKVLARNDTGETGSHQAGIVLPRRLAAYFPRLGRGSGPTADHEIIAELYDGDRHVDTVQTRFQSQTWGGERSPEHRLTRNLRPLLSRARAGDIVVFQRQIGTDDRFRLVLIHQGTPEYKAIGATARSTPVVNPAEPPATQADFNKTTELMDADILKPFVPTETDAEVKLSIVQRRVRTELFQTTVRSSYDCFCALCGRGMMTPTKIPEVEAAHIIPRGDNGTNDPRNGVALCCSHHWAFDRLLWTLTPDHKILVPTTIRAVPGNAELAAVSGKPLRLPTKARLAPALEATEHHRKRTIGMWGS